LRREPVREIGQGGAAASARSRPAPVALGDPARRALDCRDASGLSARRTRRTVPRTMTEPPMTIAPNSLAARDIAYTVHPYTNLRLHERQGPLVITGGEGVWVWDDEGKRYIEGLAGLWCTSLGFSE